MSLWGSGTESSGDNPDLPRSVLIGEESEHNGNVLYMDRRGDTLAGEVSDD